jgi:hypothetical protein
MPSEEAWVVVVAKPGGEHIAEASLAGGGWSTYCPRFRRQLKGVRIAPDGRRVRTRGAGSIVLRPLFPRYLFARLSEGRWWEMRSASGVVSVVMVPDSVPRLGERDRENRPALVAPELVEAIRESVERGDFDEPRPLRRDLRRLLDAGENPLVQVNGHPIIGRLVGLDDHGRATVA